MPRKTRSAELCPSRKAGPIKPDNAGIPAHDANSEGIVKEVIRDNEAGRGAGVEGDVESKPILGAPPPQWCRQIRRPNSNLSSNRFAHPSRPTPRRAGSVRNVESRPAPAQLSWRCRGMIPPASPFPGPVSCGAIVAFWARSPRGGDPPFLEDRHP